MICYEDFCDVILNDNIKMDYLTQVVTEIEGNNGIAMICTNVKDINLELVYGDEYKIITEIPTKDCNGKLITIDKVDLGYFKLNKIIKIKDTDNISEAKYVFTKGEVDIESFLTRYVENKLFDRIRRLENILGIK